MEPVINAIRDSGKVSEVEFYLYNATGHGFFNGLGPIGRNLTLTIGRPLPPEDSVTQSFQRVTAFLAKHLKAQA